MNFVLFLIRVGCNTSLRTKDRIKLNQDSKQVIVLSLSINQVDTVSSNKLYYIIFFRDYSFRAGNTEKGRPVYYVLEEPDSLHADRSPYDYEPADSRNSFPEPGIEFSHSGV